MTKFLTEVLQVCDIQQVPRRRETKPTAFGVIQWDQPEERARWSARYTFETEDHGVVFVDYPDGVEFVQAATRSDRWFPAQFTSRIADDQLPYGAELEFETQNGWPVCTALRVTRHVASFNVLTLGDEATLSLRTAEEREIASEPLRKLPVRRLIRLATASALHSAPDPDGIRTTAATLDEWDQLLVSETGARGHYELSEEFLKDEVASVYLAALRSGKPTDAVRRHLNVSAKTAARYVHKARERELLPPTTRGRVSAPPSSQEQS